MPLRRWWFVALLVAGCSSSPHGGNDGGRDFAVPVDGSVVHDLGVPGDLALAALDLARPDDETPPADLIPGPVPAGAFGEWLLDGDATDSSGNGNNGTVSGTFVAAANRKGVVGHALSFDGATTIPFASTTSRFTTALSVSFWLKAVTSAATNNGWPISESNGNLSPYSFAVSNDNLWLVSGGGSTVLTTFPDGDTGWVHVVLVWDIGGMTATPYINGAKDKSTAFTMVSYGGTQLVFGVRGSLPHYNGYLDDVRMYDRLLTSSEVAELYAE